MLKIYITRHGQNEDNVTGILNGHRDLPLTSKGIEQAEKIGEKIKEKQISFNTIYSSPLIRAYDTAKIISKIISSVKPEIEPLLIERDFGIMTGNNISDIEKMCAPNILKAEVITYFLNPDGAETFPDLLRRAELLLNKIKERHLDGNILLVTHGDIGKMIYAKYYNINWEEVLKQFHFGNCDLLILSGDSLAGDAHVFKTAQYNH